VDSQGVVTILDSAGYENITVSKPVTIMAAPGALPSLTSTNTNGAVITINFVSGTVTLMGLTLDGGTQAADTGISFLFGPALIIKNSIIKNFSASGIALVPNMASTIAVSDTMVADNGGYGILLQPPSSVGKVSAVFKHVEAYNNALAGIGIFGNLNPLGATSATAIDCVAAFNNIGYRASGSNGTPSDTAFTEFRINRSSATSNSTGVVVDAHAGVVLSQSEFEDNTLAALTSNNGGINTYGDNYTFGYFPQSGSISKF
jgi:hypothetical protein